MALALLSGAAFLIALLGIRFTKITAGSVSLEEGTIGEVSKEEAKSKTQNRLTTDAPNEAQEGTVADPQAWEKLPTWAKNTLLLWATSGTTLTRPLRSAVVGAEKESGRGNLPWYVTGTPRQRRGPDAANLPRARAHTLCATTNPRMRSFRGGPGARRRGQFSEFANLAPTGIQTANRSSWSLRIGGHGYFEDFPPPPPVNVCAHHRQTAPARARARPRADLCHVDPPARTDVRSLC